MAMVKVSTQGAGLSRKNLGIMSGVKIQVAKRESNYPYLDIYITEEGTFAIHASGPITIKLEGNTNTMEIIVKT